MKGAAPRELTKLAGTLVRLNILRDGHEREVDVKLSEMTSTSANAGARK